MNVCLDADPSSSELQYNMATRQRFVICIFDNIMTSFYIAHIMMWLLYWQNYDEVCV